MMKKMKRMNMTTALAALVLAMGWSVKVLADDAWATNRFFGGSFDGYDANSLIQNDTNAFNSAYARFTGGSKDGLDTSTAAGLKLSKSRGTVIFFR